MRTRLSLGKKKTKKRSGWNKIMHAALLCLMQPDIPRTPPHTHTPFPSPHQSKCQSLWVKQSAVSTRQQGLSHTIGLLLMIFWDVRLDLTPQSDMDRRTLSEVSPLSSLSLCLHPFILHISLFPVGKRRMHPAEWAREKSCQGP